MLLAVPNVSEGRDPGRIASIEGAFAGGTTLLDRHTDSDHNRSVFTLAGDPRPLRDGLLAGAVAAIEAIDMSDRDGLHPAIGALDVCPMVWWQAGDRESARTTAGQLAELIGDLGVPVFLYGELAAEPERAERAYFRSGGPSELWRRMESGELHPDHGPELPHRSAGATLVTARPPLAAFNIELDSGDVEIAKAVAACLREAGGGPPGVRAIGLLLGGGRAQVSTNVHDPIGVPIGEIVEKVRALAAPLGARPIEAELVGLIPAGALAGYPDDVPIRGFDPALHTIEGRLGSGTDVNSP